MGDHSEEQDVAELPVGGTRRVRVQVADGAMTFAAQVVTAIDGEADPDLLDRLADGDLNVVVAPRGGRAIPLAVPVLVNLPSHQRAVLFVPESRAHRVLLERAELLEQMERRGAQHPHLTGFDTAVGTGALRAWLANAPQQPLEDLVFRGSLGASMLRPVATHDGDGRAFTAMVLTQLNADDDPGRLRELVEGRLNLTVSPFDGSKALLPVPVLVHKPSRRRFVLHVPEPLSAQVLTERAQVLRRLAASQADLPAYVVNFETNTSAAALSSLIDATSPEHHRAPDADVVRPVLAVDLAQHDLEMNDAHDTIHLGLSPRERVRGPQQDARHPHGALHLMASLPDRFPGGEHDFWASDAPSEPTLLAWRLDAAEARAWVGYDLRLLVQFHNLEMYPLAALVLAGLGPAGEVADQRFRCLDIEDPRARALLGGLCREFAVTVALYGDSGLLDAARFVGPLEANVDALLRIAERRLSQEPSLDFAAAEQHFSAPSFPRIGTMRHPFSSQTFASLTSVQETALAVGITSYWSLEPNRRYLLFDQSFSSSLFERVRNHVLEAAVEFGVRLPPNLRELALSVGLASGPEELLQQQLAHFAEAQLRLKGTQLGHDELDPVMVWENWRLLLEDCEDFAVAVGDDLLDLARQALRAAQLAEQAFDAAES